MIKLAHSTETTSKQINNFFKNGATLGYTTDVHNMVREQLKVSPKQTSQVKMFEKRAFLANIGSTFGRKFRNCTFH